jgi:murein DD-endopeptidase MepM/ murein hydrolase activator NlpD
MLSPNTRSRVACALVLATATSIVLAVPAPAAQLSAAIDPTTISAAANAAANAKATLAEATASKALAERAATDAANAAVTAQAALLSAREHLTDLHRRVEAATAVRRAVEANGGLLDVTAGATDGATGESDSTLVDAAGTVVAAGLAGVLGPVVTALNPPAGAVDEQMEDADRDLAKMEQYEQALRMERAAAVRAQRGAAEKVSEAQGLQDAAAAVLVTAEQEEKDAGAARAAAEAAARAIAASLGIDKRLVRPGVGTISSPYGVRRHPITGVHKLHSGTDFQQADGKAYAAASGTVAAVTQDSAYGNMVTIAHGQGITTRYAHLARPLVRPGDEVAAAQVIGQIGSTGLSTGPHLHFEVQVGGEFQDPAVWLAR